MAENKKIEAVDSKGKTVVVYVKSPDFKDYREAQLVYNKAFREALESGAILKQKLQEYIKSQGIWDDAKEQKYMETLKKLNANEVVLKKGGIPLKQAREIALDMRRIRAELNEQLAERQTYESNSVEGQAENARFNHLVVCCVVDEAGKRVWANADAYDKDATETWANLAAFELSERLYGVDPNYYKNLTENEFLVKYHFANEKLRLVNKEGHLIDADGRLINEEGRYVAYRDGEQYFVNVDGEEVQEDGEVVVEFSPFLDDEGAPVDSGETAAVTEEKPARKKKAKTTE